MSLMGLTLEKILTMINKCIGFISSHYLPAKAKCHCTINTNNWFGQTLNMPLNSRDWQVPWECGGLRWCFTCELGKECECVAVRFSCASVSAFQPLIQVFCAPVRKRLYCKTTCSRPLALHTRWNNTGHGSVSPAEERLDFTPMCHDLGLSRYAIPNTPLQAGKSESSTMLHSNAIIQYSKGCQPKHLRSYTPRPSSLLLWSGRVWHRSAVWNDLVSDSVASFRKSTCFLGCAFWLPAVCVQPSHITVKKEPVVFYSKKFKFTERQVNLVMSQSYLNLPNRIQWTF